MTTEARAKEISPTIYLKVMQEARMKEILDPSLAALVVIDMQNDFLSPHGKFAALWHKDISSMQAIVPKITELTKLFKALGRPVIRTITYEDPEFRTKAQMDRYYFSAEAGNREFGVAVLKGTKGAKLYLPAEEGDIVIEKNRSSAWIHTNLPEVLEKNGIKTIFITGVKTQ